MGGEGWGQGWLDCGSNFFTAWYPPPPSLWRNNFFGEVYCLLPNQVEGLHVNPCHQERNPNLSLCTKQGWGEGREEGQRKLKVCGNGCTIATRRTCTSQRPFLDRTEHQQPPTNTCIHSIMSKPKIYIYFAAGILHLAAS